MGLGYVTVSVEVGLGDAIERLGKPMGLPQSLPPARVCEILPPEVALLLEAGGAGENSTEVPPSTVRRAMGEEPTGVGVPGGRTPGHGVMKRLGGVPPPDCECLGVAANVLAGVPPQLQDVQEGEGLYRLVPRVGAHWVWSLRRKCCNVSSPLILCFWGGLNFFCKWSPPLLQCVHEGGGGQSGGPGGCSLGQAKLIFFVRVPLPDG